MHCCALLVAHAFLPAHVTCAARPSCSACITVPGPASAAPVAAHLQPADCPTLQPHSPPPQMQAPT